MPSSFVTYIDESGCDGFKFGDGSSEWIVLAAVVFRRPRELQDVRVIDDVRAAIKKPPTHDLHFRELRHEHRVVYTNRLGQSLIRCCAVMVHKPSIDEPGTFHAKNLLYHYASRYLIERVSWICSHNRLSEDPGDGYSDIVFSHRRTTPHTEIAAYLEKLRTKDTEIEWGAIDPARVRAFPHRVRKGLLVADAVASSFWYGMERNQHGFTEGRYAQELRNVVWKSRGTYNAAGIKIWPKQALAVLDSEDKHRWLKDTYGIAKK